MTHLPFCVRQDIVKTILNERNPLTPDDVAASPKASPKAQRKSKPKSSTHTPTPGLTSRMPTPSKPSSYTPKAKPIKAGRAGADKENPRQTAAVPSRPFMSPVPEIKDQRAVRKAAREAAREARDAELSKILADGAQRKKDKMANAAILHNNTGMGGNSPVKRHATKSCALDVKLYQAAVPFSGLGI